MNRFFLRCSISFASVVTLTQAFALAAPPNWPQFRGPGSRGIAESEVGHPLPDHWSAIENVAWKSDIAGRGWSSPIVWGNRVFVTTAVNLGNSEEPKKGLYFGGNRPTPPESVHQWKVLCLELETGKILWERQVHEGKPATSIHLKNSFASETPVTDGERIYCCFGGLGVYCLDLDGKVIWQHGLEPHETRYGWGSAASPVLHDGRVYLVNGDRDRCVRLRT